MSMRILLVSGSLRAGSTNTAALLTAAALVPAGIEAVPYDGLAALPAFNPDLDGDRLPPQAAALREAIRAADALLLSTPEYAGALPGSFKNLLDWTIGDDRAGSIYEKPVAWMNVSSHGAISAHESLRKVLGYATALIVEDACAVVPVTRSMLGTDGLVSDPSTRERIGSVIRSLAAGVLRSAGSD